MKKSKESSTEAEDKNEAPSEQTPLASVDATLEALKAKKKSAGLEEFVFF